MTGPRVTGQTGSLRVGRERLVLLVVVALAGLLLTSLSTHPSPQAFAATDVTLSFDANEDQHQSGVTTGSPPSPILVASGEAVTVPGAETMARAGFEFVGWTVEPDGSGTIYGPGETVSLTLNADTTLYAKWFIPEAARLFGLGGEQKVAVTHGNVRGITTDGSSVFYVASNDTGAILRNVNFDGSSKDDLVVTGPLAAAVVEAVRVGMLDLAYSSGHIFARGDKTNWDELYAINASTGVVQEVTLADPTKPFVVGQTWLKGNLIDFPDGRIGAVSASNTILGGSGKCPIGFYCKFLRLYTVSVAANGTVSATWSEDILLADTESGWPNDDHGIATDGTYLYQPRHLNGYKVWALQGNGEPSYLVFNGDGTGACGAPTAQSGTLCPIGGPYGAGVPAGFTMGNSTYFARDHVNNRYMMGDFDGKAILLTDGFAPPPGPGSISPASAPRDVTVVAGDSEVTVEWSEPDTGTPITRYTVTASPGGATCTTSTTQCLVTGLTNGVDYTFTVVARNNGGDSAAATSPVGTPSGAPEEQGESDGDSAGREGSSGDGGASGRSGQSTAPLSGPNISGPELPLSRPGVNRDRLSQTPPPPTLSAPVINRSYAHSSAITRVTIGGRSVVPTVDNLSGRTVSVTAAGLQVEIRSLETSRHTQVVNNPLTGQPELGVTPGGTLEVSGRGFLPGSTIQVWAPDHTTKKELGRSSVNSDGQGNLSVSFMSGVPGYTLPIGPHRVQVTGFNSEGKTVVIDMVVRVGQGQIVPEVLRETRALPNLQPGHMLATSAGLRDVLEMELSDDNRQLKLDAGDWGVQIDVSETLGRIVGSGQAVRLVMNQGGSGTLRGGGLQPGTTVSIWLFSAPTLLETATVHDDGSFVVNLALQGDGLPLGDHTLQIQGVGVDGFVKAANLGVELGAPNGSWGQIGWVIVGGGFLATLVAGTIVIVALRRGARINTAR